ncbi:MAG: HAD family hydrolase [Mariniblastus sp.]
MPDIDFIYFDLGKVILDFDHDVGCEQVATVAGISSADAKAAIFDSGLEDRYETGLVTDDEFHAEFCKATNSSPSKADLLRATSDIFKPVEGTSALIEELRGLKFPMGILSNTCPAHWDLVSRDFSILKEAFPIVILSYEAKSMKPDSKIYQRAIESAGDQVQKCFFVDDKQENVDGANANGMDAVLFTSAMDLREQLIRRGVALK